MFILRVILKSGVALEWPATPQEAQAFLNDALLWRKLPWWRRKMAWRTVSFSDGGGHLIEPMEIAAVSAIGRPEPQAMVGPDAVPSLLEAAGIR